MGEEQEATFESGEAAELGQQQEVTTENQTGEQSVEHEGKITQEIFNREMNKKTVKIHEATTKSQGLEKKLNELEQKLTGLQATPEPVIPPIPEQYDDDFDRKMRERDTKINERAKFDNQQETLRLQKENNQKQTAQQAQEAQQKVVASFNAKTSELGLDPKDIETAAGTVMSYGVTGELANFILNDPDGPLILKHLANNHAELDSLTTMDPMSAAVRISTSIRAEAQKLKPKQSQTPDPGIVLRGSGAATGEHPSVKAATFE